MKYNINAIVFNEMKQKFEYFFYCVPKIVKLYMILTPNIISVVLWEKYTQNQVTTIFYINSFY